MKFTIIFKYRKNIIKNNNLLINIVLILLLTIFIFGIGVQNAGTAMRHRQKILPVFFSVNYYNKKRKY